MALLQILQILSAAFAWLAAVLWFVSAVVKTPATFAIHVVRPTRPPLGGDPLGGATYMGNAYSEDLQELARKLRRQSKCSAGAATSAGVAALLQGVALVLSR